MKKYLVIGGYVGSKTDDDIHYINADRLCRLYGLNRMDCFLTEGDLIPKGLLENRFEKVFRPRFDGNYKWEEEK